MRALVAPSLLLTLALAGCTSEPTSTLRPEAQHLAHAAAPAPHQLTGQCETSFSAPPFPLPPVLRQVDTGVCQLSHLGRATLHAVQEIDLATGTQRSLEFTLTAANGDVLRATSVGTSVPDGPGVRFAGTATFIGGTGRFADATGEARLEGTASFLTNTAAFTIVEGWIAYDASGRAPRP